MLIKMNNKLALSVQHKQYPLCLGSGCGSVGRAVAFDTRGPWFDSSHRQNFNEHFVYYQLY